MEITKIIALSAALLGASCFTSANAGLLVIDDFLVPQGPIWDYTLGDGPENSAAVPTVNGRTRVLSTDLVLGSYPFSNRTEIANSFLDVNNGTSEDSQVSLTWQFLSNMFPNNLSSARLFFEVISSDGNTTNLNFFLNGTNISTLTLPGNLHNTVKYFDLNLQTVASAISNLNGGGLLTLKIDGAIGWDLRLDLIGLDYSLTPPSLASSVPEPATISFLSMVLVSLGFLLKRKAANVYQGNQSHVGF